MVATNYRACLKEILKHEGGYVNHPRDPGGETNYGITKATARAAGYHGSMRAIPMDVVEAIYRNRFWRSGSGDCDRLVAGVDLATFDFAVNSGPARAWKYLLRSVGGNGAHTVKTLCAKRMGFLQMLGTWATFGKGWTRRVANVEAVGVKMALAAEGAMPAEVAERLEQESASARTKSSNSGKAAGGVAGAEVGKDATATQTDLVQWLGSMEFSLVSAALIVLAIFLAMKWHQHKQRAAAYAAAAKDDPVSWIAERAAKKGA